MNRVSSPYRSVLGYLGLHYTSGLVKRKDFIGQFDSDVVTLMKKAGAIMLAITNVPELCMWWESLNNVYGRSRNPYDINRTVGGSSGGEVGKKNHKNVVCIANRDNNTFDNNKIISI